MKKLLLGLVLLAAAVVAGGLLLPSSYEVSRSTTVRADRAAIHAIVDDLRTWPDWTPWNTSMDPEAVYTYSGPDHGVGQVSAWDGPEMGDGTMTITRSDPSTGIEFSLAFEGGTMVSVGAIELADGPDGSVLVTMRNSGELDGLLGPWFGLVLDRMLGSDFEQCMAGLRAKAEGGA